MTKIFEKMYKTFGTHSYFVYILTNKNKTVLYIGVTNNLEKRLYEHKHLTENIQSFTKKYNCYYLLYYEQFQDVDQAIVREKELKGWRREKKEKLITSFNPDWRFLNDDI